jgi:hypothetical protein
MDLLGDVDQIEARWSVLEIVLILMQDRYTVCAEHTTDSEIVLGAPDGTPRWRGSSESLFRFVWRQC